MMGEVQMIAIAAAVAMVGAILAAKMTGIGILKGALIGAAAVVAALVAYIIPGVDRSFVVPLAALGGAGLSGMALGLTAPQTAHVLIGAAVPPILGFALLEMAAI